jgi:hypothetical protein
MNEMKVYIITEHSVIDIRRLVAEEYIFVYSRRTKEKNGKLSKNIYGKYV